jgi:histidine ammonia-lyase
MASQLPSPSTAGGVLVVDGGPLTVEDVVRVARHGWRVALAPSALDAMAASRATVDALAASPTPAYGISTGFGALATRHISPELRTALQRSLVRSHAAGTGPEVEREVTRGLMLLRLRTLASGRTGVHPATATLLAALLSAGITPVVHEYGSLGCSGDLAPLSHVALALMGEGPVRDAAGALVPAADALAAAGLAPVTLGPKEGLALINGEGARRGRGVEDGMGGGRDLRGATLTPASHVPTHPTPPPPLSQARTACWRCCAWHCTTSAGW